MLLKRWITALVLVPLLLLILLKGTPLAFTLLVLFLSLAGMAEYFRIIFPVSMTSSSIVFSGKRPIDSYPEDGCHPSKDKFIHFPTLTVLKCIAYTLCMALIAAAHKGSVLMVLLLLAFNVIAVSLLAVLQFKSGASIFGSVTAEIQGMFYIPLFLLFLVLLRNGENGSHWVLWLWIIIGVSDTGAYYVGSNFGRHALAKHVSPNKTVEGAMGGLGAAAIVGLVYAFIFIDEISFPMSILFSIVTAAFGQLGDLFESALKRGSGIKDSGSILPGHGGILDRIDGLIFAAPVAYLFRIFIV